MKKKNLFWMFGLGVALMLTACSQDEVKNNAGNGSEGMAVFLSGTPDDESGTPGETRTSMNPDGTFYWTSGDYVFVKNGSTYVKSNNAAASRVRSMSFYMAGTYEDASYPILYTGNGNATTATSVAIKTAQRQDTADDATHLGTDGDCGNATATRTGTGSYNFNLIHRAAYLVIAPRHNLPGNVVLKSVTVSTSGTDNLCGTYTFSENTTSLKNERNSGTGDLKRVTLTVGNWTVPTVAEVNDTVAKLGQARGYMVIQPGTHTLTFNYAVTVDGTSRTFTKIVDAREFMSGVFTNVKHILSDGIFSGSAGHVSTDPAGEINDGDVEFDITSYGYYRWGATTVYPGTPYDATTVNADLTGSLWSQVPNANEMAWYVAMGDARWDPLTIWSNDGGLSEYTGGVWIKKKQHINGFKATLDPNDVNLVTTMGRHYISSSHYKEAGRPAANVINQYFFLPALGRYWQGSAFTEMGCIAAYWTRSPYADDTRVAYALVACPTYIRVDRGTANLRNLGLVVTPTWFE